MKKLTIPSKQQFSTSDGDPVSKSIPLGGSLVLPVISADRKKQMEALARLGGVKPGLDQKVRSIPTSDFCSVCKRTVWISNSVEKYADAGGASLHECSAGEPELPD